MEARNYIGLVIIIIGVGLQPVGWMYSWKAHVVSFVLIFIGVFIFATQKYLDYAFEKECRERERGRALPGDIEGHSGWDNGGKTTAFQNSSDFGGSDGGGD